MADPNMPDRAPVSPVQIKLPPPLLPVEIFTSPPSDAAAATHPEMQQAGSIARVAAPSAFAPTNWGKASLN